MSHRRRLAAGAAVLALASAVTTAFPVSPAVAATPCSAFFDANHDGFDDLVVGTPGDDLAVGGGAQVDAGVVTIVYGDATGTFGSNGSRLITQEDVGLVSASHDRFGAAVATADLNGDGCGDLAIGVPGETAGAGAVVVVWGRSTGALDPADHSLLQQGSSPVGGSREAGDAFGTTLAVAGSLPTGGAAALWVGSPGEDVGSHRDAGLVTEIKASAGGALGAAGVTNIHQDSTGVPGTAETGDRFGERLSGGGRTLLVGVPHEDVGPLADAGAYYAFSVTSRAWSTYTQDSTGVPGTAEAGDRFGSSVAHAPGCGSATDETWAVGAPGEDIGSLSNAGVVTLRDRGTRAGLALRQGAGGVPGTAESEDGFGGSLVDSGVLVVGSPGEKLGSAANAGAINLLDLGCTSSGALTVAAATTWTQSSTTIPGSPITSGRFGAALGASLVPDSGGPLEYRLVVGSSGQTDGGAAGAGTVTVFGMDATGLTQTGSVAFGQSTVAEDPEPGDGFGSSLDASNANAL